MTTENTTNTQYLTETSAIVSAYVSRNPVAAHELPDLIKSVHKALTSLGRSDETKQELTPAVNPKRSVHPDYIICLEDGKKFKSLKRHLMTHYGLTPEDYRQKWGLPSDYPMTAPNYSRQRSNLAKKMGLGRVPNQEPQKEAA